MSRLIKIVPDTKPLPEPEGYEFGYYAFEELDPMSTGEDTDIVCNIQQVDDQAITNDSKVDWGFTSEEIQKAQSVDKFCTKMLKKLVQYCIMYRFMLVQSKNKQTLLAPISENLLATAGVGGGGRGLRQPRTPTASGLHQTRPTAPPQRMPTSGRQEANHSTPYRQQIYPPRHTTGVRTTNTKLSTAPSTSQGHGEMAGESEGARGRSSSQGP